MRHNYDQIFSRMIRSILVFIGITVSLCGFLTGAMAESVVHRGNRGEPDTLDPHKTANGWEASIAMELFTGLTAFGPSGQILPAMAHDWSVSDDGLTYTWHLREGLEWSDGTPFTAADFVYSFRRLFDPATASPFASLLYPIAGAQAVNRGLIDPDELGVRAADDLTLVMELEHPTPYLPQILIHRALPVPRHVVETAGPRWARPGTLVGNGAFTLKEWIPQTHVRLEPNPRFFDAATVSLDALYFHLTENLGTAIDRLRAGEIDVVPSVPRDRLQWIEENMPDALMVHPSLGVEYLIFNVSQPPFDDVRVRQALSMALNRQVMTQSFLKGGETEAYSLVHPDVMGSLGSYRPPVLQGSSAARLKRATELLNELGYDWDNPIKVQLRYNNQDIVAATMDVVARMWSRLFIETELIGSDTPTLYADTRDGNFQIARAAWYPEVVDPSTYLYLLKSNSGPMNQSGYNNPEYDALLDKADRTVDGDQRLAVYREAEQLIGDDQPLAPLFYYAFRNLVSPKVQGWEIHSRNTHPGRFLSVRED